ncbi:unnamed protein product, partial [Mesorhabditis spiculigera]
MGANADNASNFCPLALGSWRYNTDQKQPVWDDGTPIDYTNWDDGQPTGDVAAKQCIVMHTKLSIGYQGSGGKYYVGKWFNEDCHVNNGYCAGICKIPNDGANTNDFSKGPDGTPTTALLEWKSDADSRCALEGSKQVTTGQRTKEF